MDHPDYITAKRLINTVKKFFEDFRASSVTDEEGRTVTYIEEKGVKSKGKLILYLEDYD